MMIIIMNTSSSMIDSKYSILGKRESTSIQFQLLKSSFISISLLKNN